MQSPMLRWPGQPALWRRSSCGIRAGLAGRCIGIGWILHAVRRAALSATCRAEAPERLELDETRFRERWSSPIAGRRSSSPVLGFAYARPRRPHRCRGLRGRPRRLIRRRWNVAVPIVRSGTGRTTPLAECDRPATGARPLERAAEFGRMRSSAGTPTGLEPDLRIVAKAQAQYDDRRRTRAVVSVERPTARAAVRQQK